VSEKWVRTAEGRHLSGRRKESTAPEISLRKALHAAGARFRLHRHLAKGCTPDVVLPSRHVAVFVDGCFWHTCPEHGHKGPWTGPNADLWSDKMRRNHERDEYSTRTAQELGWQVFRIWECEVRRDCSDVVARVLGEASSSA
jgi:DNA mismatch endonuclease, patch repair protein